MILLCKHPAHVVSNYYKPYMGNVVIFFCVFTEIVDCDKTDSGCNGGYMTSAYEAIEKIGGLELEDEYPYDAQDETCKFNSSEVKIARLKTRAVYSKFMVLM